MRFAKFTIFFLLPLRAETAQFPATKAAESAPAAKVEVADRLGRSTPRGCVTEFLRAAGHDDYARAARYLDTGTAPAEAYERARQLKFVLDLGLLGNVENLPRTLEGDLLDGLPPTRQKVGTIKTKAGTLEVVLDRVQRGTEPAIWLFSAATLEGVPRTYRELQPGDIANHVPTSLSQVRFLSLPLWRWFAIFINIAIALLSAVLLTRGSILLLRPLVRRLTGEHDDRLLAALRLPIGLLLFAVAIRVLGLFGGLPSGPAGLARSGSNASRYWSCMAADPLQ